MSANSEVLQRAELLLGADVLDAVKNARVAVFGVGGVGSWCVEALVRTGVRRLMLVDSDRVCESNINRQMMATTRTVGRAKVEAIAERLREINPAVELELRDQFYDATTADSFDLAQWDFVVDAIDSLDSKVLLIRRALAVPTVTLFSSMGAARKLDPFQIRRDNFKKVSGDGLARALRRKFRETGGIPERPFVCVWSPEQRDNIGEAEPVNGKRPNGTVMHVTASFGLALASLVLEKFAVCS